MHALVGDLEGIELVGEGAEAVLLGGADETPETNLVFSYMNLARAFAELELGAELYCLHRNRWWQTSARPAARLRVRSSPGSSTPRTSRRSCSASRAPPTSTAACEALDADPELTWMVGDDLESDIAGAQGVGMRDGARAHGEVPPGRSSKRRAVQPDGIVSSIAHLPDWLEEHL